MPSTKKSNQTADSAADGKAVAACGRGQCCGSSDSANGSHRHAHSEQGAVTSCCVDVGGAAEVPSTDAATAVLQSGEVRTRLRISQMDCPTEETLIRKKLGNMAEVRMMDFNLMQRVLTVVHLDGALERVIAAIRSLDMVPEIMSDDSAAGALPPPPASAMNWKPLALAAVLAVLAEVSNFAGAGIVLTAALALGAVIACGLSTYRKGWIAIRTGNLNINALMSIAVTGAMIIGEWPEAAMVMVLFNLAELIEARSLDRARNAVRNLLDLAPEMATVRQPDGTWQEMPCAQLQIDNIVRVRPGERIGADGTIVAGRSAVDQSPITGESIPVEKEEGDSVFAATININGAFEYRVTAAAGQTTLARIIHAVEAAQGARAPVQRFIDQFARIYTPAVVGLSVLAIFVLPLVLQHTWLSAIYTALTMLIIACPCALVISTPVTIVSGLTAASRNGILIKGGAYLEAGRKLAWLALDKTGTITYGKPQRTDWQDWDVPATSLLPAGQLAASLAARSDHPVSIALAQAAQRDGVETRTVEDLQALPGSGVSGVVDGVQLYLGNQRLMEKLGVNTSALEARIVELEQQGKTVVALSDGERVLWLAAVMDTIKPGSAAAIADLHTLGVRTLMLSGDNRYAVAAIAAQTGIDEALGNQLPEDKQAMIQQRREAGETSGAGKVGMVGDGINDAPALASADIGFAMGAAGTGTAIETADVALMDDDLRKVGAFIRLSRATHRVLVQNITLALGIKVVFLTLAILGYASLWMAVFADVGASLLVVGNGLRLLRMRAAASAV